MSADRSALLREGVGKGRLAKVAVRGSGSENSYAEKGKSAVVPTCSHQKDPGESPIDTCTTVPRVELTFCKHSSWPATEGASVLHTRHIHLPLTGPVRTV